MARYGSVNEALMPASLAATVLEWPALVAFGIPEWPVYYLIPTQAPWLLMRAGLEPIAPWQVAYAFAASAIWLAVAGRLALGAYRRLGMG